MMRAVWVAFGRAVLLARLRSSTLGSSLLCFGWRRWTRLPSVLVAVAMCCHEDNPHVRWNVPDSCVHVVLTS